MKMKHFHQAILVLLLPLLLIPQAQGIRFTKVREMPIGVYNELGSGQVTLPDSMQYQGKSRKLLIAATAATTTIPSSTNQKIGIPIDELPASRLEERNEGATSSKGNDIVKGNELAATSKGNAKEGFSTKSTTATFKHYPSIVDIADYSPAKRKPPIHN